MKLREILSNLLLEARFKPGQEEIRQLGHGMGVVVRVNADLQATLWVTRVGVPPADKEMNTTLKHADAPPAALDPNKWKRGRSRRSGKFYISAQWQLQPELLPSDPIFNEQELQ